MTNDLRRLFDKAHQASENRRYKIGRLGKHNPDDTVDFEVPGRVDYLYVTMPDHTVAIARNEAGVPQTEDMQVKLYRDHSDWVIAGRSTAGQLSYPNQTPADGVPAHLIGSHSDVDADSPASGDVLINDGTNYVNTNLNERIRNTIAAALVEGSNIVITVDDPGDTITIAASGAGYTQEEIEDFVAAQLTGNTGIIDATYNDGTGAITLTLDVSAADKILYSTAADTWSETTLTSFARTLLDDADQATMRATLGVTDEIIQDLVGLMVTGNTETLITVTYQDSDGTLDFEITDAELTALAGLTSAADRLPYFTGSGTASLATFTAFARTLLDDADAATARTTLGLVAGGAGDIWVELAGDTMTGQLKLDSTLLLSDNANSGTQDYLLTSRASAYVLQSQSSATTGQLDLMTKDGDGTDDLNLILWGVGLPNSVTNRERLLARWDSGNSWYSLNTDNGGTGTLRPLRIFTGSDSDQVVLATDGRVGVQQTTPTAQFEVIGTATSGETVRATRNLASGSTDSPVVYILQDHASDDQPSLRVGQDGSGDIVQVFDGATQVFVIEDGGQVGIGVTPNATLHVSQTQTAGEALRVTRNLTATSTDSPVVYILQDHASDDQVALLIKQDGTASALQLQTTAAGPLLDFSGGYSITEGSNTFNTGFFRGSSDDAIAFTLVRGSAANVLMGAGVNGDTFRRIVIQADGKILLGDGSSDRDTNLYRAAANVLATDDVLSVGGLATPGASHLAIQAGTSTNDAAAGGVLYESRTQTGNVGSGEDDLASYSVPANTLSANGMGLRIKAWGRFANNGNLKRVRARFGTSGTTLLLQSDGASFTNQVWQLEAEIVRTGAATQRSAAKLLIGDSSGASAATVYMEHNNSLDQTLSGAVTLKVTAEATSNDDVVIDEVRIEWLDNNT